MVTHSQAEIARLQEAAGHAQQLQQELQESYAGLQDRHRVLVNTREAGPLTSPMMLHSSDSSWHRWIAGHALMPILPFKPHEQAMQHASRQRLKRTHPAHATRACDRLPQGGRVAQGCRGAEEGLGGRAGQ